MRAAGAGSSRALRRADSAIFAFGSSASRIAATRAEDRVAKACSIASRTGCSVQRAGKDRSASKAAARTAAIGGGQARADFDRGIVLGLDAGERAQPAEQSPARPPGRRAGLGRAVRRPAPCVAGIGFAAADLEGELLGHGGRPLADRAVRSPSRRATARATSADRSPRIVTRA